MTPAHFPQGWRRRKLGDLFRIRHGYAFKGEHFASSGPYVLLTPGNFHDEGGFKDKGEKEKHYTGEVPPEYILRRGDLLIAMTEQAEGLLGSSAIVPDSGRYLHNQRLGLITELNEEEVDKSFLYYLFNDRHVRNQIRASASGVKVRHTSPSRVYAVEMEIPPLEVQRRIAGIISAYVDLILNNTRRIAILEEMARALYREWLVHFRFPGHEKVKMIESPLGKIPEGWETKRLGAMAEDVRRSVQPSELAPNTPYFGLEHLPRRSIALSEWGLVREVRSTKLRFTRGEILFGKIRPYFHKVGVAPVDGVCSSDAIVISSKTSADFPLVPKQALGDNLHAAEPKM